MWRNKWLWRLAVVWLVPLTAGFSDSPGTTVGEIKKSLVCQCDCAMTVEACQGAMACQVAEQLTAEATTYVEQGLASEAVLATFVQKYGEHILAAPTKTGFNLLAWVLPFALIFGVGFVLVKVLRRWAARGLADRTLGESPGGNATADADPAYQKALDAVLRELEE